MTPSQLLGETLQTKSDVLVLPEVMPRHYDTHKNVAAATDDAFVTTATAVPAPAATAKGAVFKRKETAAATAHKCARPWPRSHHHGTADAAARRLGPADLDAIVEAASVSQEGAELLGPWVPSPTLLSTPS